MTLRRVYLGRHPRNCVKSVHPPGLSLQVTKFEPAPDLIGIHPLDSSPALMPHPSSLCSPPSMQQAPNQVLVLSYHRFPSVLAGSRHAHSEEQERLDFPPPCQDMMFDHDKDTPGLGDVPRLTEENNILPSSQTGSWCTL